MKDMDCKMKHLGLLGMVLFVLVACQDELLSGSAESDQAVSLMGRMLQQNETRANDNGFVDGDRMGIYMVDYVNGQPGTLSPTDNRATNVLYTFNANVNKWESATTLYWKDKTTPADFYGYYPGVNHIENPAAYSFEVSYQQHIVPEEGEMSNYEASDFLWGKVEKVTPTTETIVLSYKHRMAGVSVKLVMGKDFTQTEWDKLKKQVQVDNTIRTATIDLANGEPVATGSVDKSIQMMAQSDGTYRAVVVPQKVDAGKKLLSFTLDEKSYTHSLPSVMHYQMGKMHVFSVTIDKKETSGDYSFAVSYDGITDWVNDEISHSFSSNTYISIHCSKMGTLKQCIADAGYDYKEMQNLKVTGEITESDIRFINDEMKNLKHLNTRDVKLKNIRYYDGWWDHGNNDHDLFMDGCLPDGAFKYNGNLRSIVLPSSLKRVGREAFRESKLMYSTLEIPEGVTYVGEYAFAYNDYNGVELVLPLSLDSIESRAFAHCQYSCNFQLSDNLKYLGNSAFSSCRNFYGTFQIPSSLKTLEGEIFSELGQGNDLTGKIEIPQGITEIGDYIFHAIGLDNRYDLNLPQGIKRIGQGAFVAARLNSIHFNDDLEEIGRDAFYASSMPFQITLPSQLKLVEQGAFMEAGLQGELVIPESCLNIGGGAFAGNGFTKITLPSQLEMIPEDCFRSLGSLLEITIPKYVDFIGNSAFYGDGALQTIVCLNPEPPTLGSDVFNDVNMDKVVLQVPEQSVGKYRNDTGWSQFRNITAYRELAFNIPKIVTMDKGMNRQGVLRAEGAWEVAESPSWVTVSPSSGKANELLTVTVHEQSQGAGTREGEIVFRLVGTNYTTTTVVKQISSELAQDQTVVLQESSAGTSKSVPLFIVGDGYDAEEIVSGKYMQDMREQMEHFFSIEPFKSYRNYFTVSTAYVCSPESGTDVETYFGCENYDGAYGDSQKVWQYALTHAKGITSQHEADATVMVLVNKLTTANNTDIHDSGRTVSWVGKSNDTSPFDQKSQVLREVGGIAFGKLGPEGVNHFTFMKSCTCPGCDMTHVYEDMRRKGWYQNVSISAKMNDLPWKHYIFHEKYSKYVDLYEGALRHSRGAYRSENISIMGNTYIPYFNTISREMIVRRIMECAGEKFSLDKFIANDKIEIPE